MRKDPPFAQHEGLRVPHGARRRRGRPARVAARPMASIAVEAIFRRISSLVNGPHVRAAPVLPGCTFGCRSLSHRGSLACSAKGAQSLGRSAYPLRVARSPLPTAAATAGRAQGRVISTLLHVAELSSMALAGRPQAPSARRRGCAAAAGAVGSAHVAHRLGSALSSLASIFVCVSDAGAPGSQPRVVYPNGMLYRSSL